VWRGIAADGSDLEILEKSRRRKRSSGSAGGSEMDSAYLYLVLPALRDTGMFRFPGSFECLGSTIHLDLEDNEMFWYDCGAFNGFTLLLPRHHVRPRFTPCVGPAGTVQSRPMPA